MPSNSSWVCFECRQALRRANWPIAREPARCSRCGGECFCIGHKIPLPPKRDARGWKSLRERMQSLAIDAQGQNYAQRVRSIHRLQRNIADLEARPANQGREQAMKVLRQRLDELQGRRRP